MAAIMQHYFFLLTAILYTNSYSFAQDCPENMHRSKCVSVCPPTCERPVGPLCDAITCNNSCECDRGYVLLKHGSNQCILEERCKNCGKPGFIFNECGSECNTTCESVARTSGKCNKMCHPGCYCTKGVYDEQRKKCVAREECEIYIVG